MRFILLIILFCSSAFVFCQSRIKKDIDSKYLNALYIERDSTLSTEFQRFAINLFINGAKVSDSILKNDQYKVGVTLINKNKNETQQALEMTLYTLGYKDLRTKNFHRSLYYGRGKEGLSNFYVDYDTEDQKKAIDEAVISYLKYDSIPRTNDAYYFANNYFIEDEYYEKFYDTDDRSIVIIGASYAYLRQNGNYIIQIEGFPDKALKEDSEALYVTDYFINDWYAISVFIIDDSNGKAYNTIFKY